MNKSLLCVAGTLFLSFVSMTADIASASNSPNVWTTGIDAPNSGAFGPTGSVSDNTLNAEINSGGQTANIELEASNANWFRLSDTDTSGTNNQLVPFFENDAPLTQLSLSSDLPLENTNLLLHNVWNATDSNAPNGLRTNYIGNFRVTYADGTIVENASPDVRAINDNSPFATDFEGETLQPSDLDSVFDSGNILTMSPFNFDPGNGAPEAHYWFDLSQSLMSESQGFGIFSFEDANGGITGIDFTWVGNTLGTNTAFLGFAADVLEPNTIPEPAGILIIAGIVSLSILRRRR